MIILSVLGILSLIPVRGRIGTGTKDSVHVISPMDGDKRHQGILPVYHYVKQDKIKNKKDLYVTTKFPSGKHQWALENVPFVVYRDPALGRVALNSYWDAVLQSQILSTDGSNDDLNSHYEKRGVLGYVTKVGRAPVYQYSIGAETKGTQKENYLYTRNKFYDMGNSVEGETDQGGYKRDGIAFYAVYFENEQVPVYQYWNSHNRDHFYTPNAYEIGSRETGKIGRFGYEYKGIAFRLFRNPALDRIPVYRYWNAGIHNHFYTTNVDLIGTVTTGETGKYGYKYEGIIGYGLAFGQWPVYQYWNSGNHDHFYTQNVNGPKHGYVSEGVWFYSSS